MKNRGIFLLVLVTVLFVGFTCGFFIGRNMNHGNVELSRLQEQTTAPSVAVPVPTGDLSASQPPEIPIPGHSNSKLNINTATKEQLMQLPGIGETLAQSIIYFRNNNGDFQNTADLLLVEGIGEKRLDAIIDLITV